MASTSTTADRPERESTDTYQGTASFPFNSVTSSSPSLCSSCFDWVCCFNRWPSVQSNSMASTSIPDRIPENEVMASFEGIAPSVSTSTADLIPENEDMGAFHGTAPSASTSGSTLTKKPCYDVFINHGGPDFKHTLASSIYNNLNLMMTAFLDSGELEYRALEEAMRNVSLHIAIFSENYEKSSRFLEELSFMVKTRAKIIPVFYHVDPTDLREVGQGKGKYVKAFEEHEQKGRYSLEKLKEWKTALYNVSFYNGQIIKTNDDEKSVLRNIVSCVLEEIENVSLTVEKYPIGLKEIENVPSVVAKYPVGLKEIVQDFEECIGFKVNTLQSAHGNQDVQIVGIWGIGGSGKTTLAKELYNKISSLMERSSFVSDVRDAATKGLLHEKQKELLNNLGFQGVAFDNIEKGIGTLSRRLRSVRVLIVLDDVDKVEQLDALLPAKDSLGRGSLIIVTTSAYDVLKSWGISSTYKMRQLDPLYAKQLFCWHAFSKSCPPDGFKELVEKFIQECDGLPLSLEVFGAQLSDKSGKEHWESELHKISRRILPDDIKQKLQISYDTLDDEEKEIFLDTACFFIGEQSSLAIEVWNGLGWSSLRSWERLLHKCLVELDDNNCIRMHAHLRDLGRDIANKQSPYRLWYPEQTIDVFNPEEKRIGIQGIMATSTETLNTYYNEGNEKFREADDYPVRCSRGELTVKTNCGLWSLAPSSVGLKYLVISGNYFNQVMGEVSRELVWLRWLQIRQRNLQSGLSFKKLRVLELYEGWEGEHHLEELWGETDGEAPVQLRQLLIWGCHSFRGFPSSIGRLNHLKKIVIIGGYNVTSLPDEFCLLQWLEHLDLNECTMLSSLPSNFGNLQNLRHLCLSGCVELMMLPASFKNLMLLEYLNLRLCYVLTFTSDVLQNMTKLEMLSLIGCENLEELPRHITNQAFLKVLYLRGTNIRELPDDIGQLSRLTEMSIGGVLLKSLPTSLAGLSSLTNLSIYGCSELECLPDSVGDLNLLKELEIHDSGVKSLPKSVRQLNNLQRLIISGCPITELDFGAASLASGLSNLKFIHLRRTKVRRISIFEDCCPCLETLTLENNHHLKEIEALPTTLKSLKLTECEMVKSIPSFARTTSLREFEVRGCHQIEKIEGLEYCRTLESLRVDTCWEVPGIESLDRMEKLRKLQLRANKWSAIERCIQTIQKWPDEIQICTKAVPDASSLVDSGLPPDLVAVGSFSNQKIQSGPKLVQKRSSNDDAIMLCFIINCVSSQMTLTIHGLEVSEYLTKIEKGRWAWIGVFTQRYEGSLFISKELSISGYGGECEEEDAVEKGLVVTGEENRIVEAFHKLISSFTKLKMSPNLSSSVYANTRTATKIN